MVSINVNARGILGEKTLVEKIQSCLRNAHIVNMFWEASGSFVNPNRNASSQTCLSCERLQFPRPEYAMEANCPNLPADFEGGINLNPSHLSLRPPRPGLKGRDSRILHEARAAWFLCVLCKLGFPRFIYLSRHYPTKPLFRPDCYPRAIYSSFFPQTPYRYVCIYIFVPV